MVWITITISHGTAWEQPHLAAWKHEPGRAAASRQEVIIDVCQSNFQLNFNFYLHFTTRLPVCTYSCKELCGTGPGTTLCCLIVDVKWGENTLYCRCHNIAPSGHFASTHYTLYTNHQYTHIYIYIHIFLPLHLFRMHAFPLFSTLNEPNDPFSNVSKWLNKR